MDPATAFALAVAEIAKLIRVIIEKTPQSEWDANTKFWRDLAEKIASHFPPKEKP